LSLVIVAVALSPVYPIIKKIWTVPFNLLTAGISFLLLALFYFIIDVKGWQKGTLFFRVIGLNSITIYLGVRIIDFYHTSEFLLGWLSKPAGDFGAVIIIAGAIIAEWLFLYYLYKNKIFLRV
jgi:predicted acyltransferase